MEPVPVAVVVADLHSALDEADNLAMGSLPGEAAVGWLVDLQAIQARVQALVCRSFRLTGTAGVVAAETGHRSVPDLIAARAGANPRTLRADSRLGVWLDDYPVLAEAFATGRISKEHVHAIRARENKRTRPYLPQAQAYLIEAARMCPWVEFLVVIRYWELAADPDGEEPHDQRDDRSCSYQTRADGSVTGRFTLDPLAGQAVTRAIEAQVQRLFRVDTEAGSLRTATQRRADALLHVITNTASDPTRDPLIHVVISEAVIADHLNRTHNPNHHDEDQHDGPSETGPPGTGRLPLDYRDEIDGRCELIDGTPLHPSYALAVMATAAFRRLVLDPESETTDLGRQTRSFPPHLKQALLIKARGRCQHPGCDAPTAWLQADHLTPWSRQGPTNLSNGQILCDPHNKLKRDKPPPRRDQPPEDEPPQLE